MKATGYARLRELLQHVYHWAWNCGSRELSASELQHDAIVFAPHQDDETLACGGTIVQKIRAGASVQIVYLTDGSGSHPGLIEPQQLTEIREHEAIAATQVLGVPAQNIIFLRFPDGNLNAYAAQASTQISEVLQKFKPTEIFIPHHREPLYIPDHAATNQIVKTALQQAKLTPLIYEYPVWLWDHYPWVCYKQEWNGRLRWLRAVQNNLKLMGQLGWFLLHDFRWTVPIQAVLDLKCQALAQYKSQTTRFIPDERWRTIADFSNGDFLRCFLRDHERFYRYRKQYKTR